MQDRFKISDHMKQKSENNRQRVLEFFRAHPFATQKQCAVELGVTTATVCNHVRVLREQMQRDDMKV